MAIQVESFPTEVGVVLRVSGRIDADTAPDFDRTCHHSILPGAKNMVLDLSALEYISSAGLSCVLSAGKALEAEGGRLVLCGLAGRPKQVFVISGLDMLFPIFESRESALRACRDRAGQG
jgi:anti-anti-sigma factor